MRALRLQPCLALLTNHACRTGRSAPPPPNRTPAVKQQGRSMAEHSTQRRLHAAPKQLCHISSRQAPQRRWAPATAASSCATSAAVRSLSASTMRWAGGCRAAALAPRREYAASPVCVRCWVAVGLLVAGLPGWGPLRQRAARAAGLPGRRLVLVSCSPGPAGGGGHQGRRCGLAGSDVEARVSDACVSKSCMPSCAVATARQDCSAALACCRVAAHLLLPRPACPWPPPRPPTRPPPPAGGRPG